MNFDILFEFKKRNIKRNILHMKWIMIVFSECVKLNIFNNFFREIYKYKINEIRSDNTIIFYSKFLDKSLYKHIGNPVSSQVHTSQTIKKYLSFGYLLSNYLKHQKGLFLYNKCLCFIKLLNLATLHLYLLIKTYVFKYKYEILHI